MAECVLLAPKSWPYEQKDNRGFPYYPLSFSFCFVFIHLSSYDLAEFVIPLSRGTGERPVLSQFCIKRKITFKCFHRGRIVRWVSGLNGEASRALGGRQSLNASPAPHQLGAGALLPSPSAR